MPTLAFQSCLGPSFGQAANQSRSLEMPFRSGPRHRGQSSPRREKAPRDKRTSAAEQTTDLMVMAYVAGNGLSIRQPACAEDAHRVSLPAIRASWLGGDVLL